MEYHLASGGILLFGGHNGASYLSDTWLWNSVNWLALTPATVPAGRMGHALGYDGGANLYMFGGELTGPALTAQTYRWDSTNWLLRTPLTTTPAARKHHAVAEGTGVNSLYMWGGDDGAAGDDDFWVYDDAFPDWFAFTPATKPERRKNHFMVTVSNTKVLMWGGVSLSTGLPLKDMWEFDLLLWDWTPVSLGATEPDARAIGQAYAYDPNSGRIVLGSSGRMATGSITAIPSTGLIDAEQFTISDGYNPDQIFEINKTGGIGPGTIAVDLTSGGLTAIQVALEVRDAVNSASLTIAARIDPTDATKVLLLNTQPGPHSVVAIDNQVSNGDFASVGMEDAEADTWSFNPSGRIWSEYSPLVQPQGVDGACCAYDGRPTVEAASGLHVPMQFGGVVRSQVTTDTYLQEHHKWAWDTLGLSPYWTYPGTLQGRIDPSPVIEAEDGDYVFVLGQGSDHLPSFMLNIGDEITLSQQLAISGNKLLRFAWRMRYSPDLPKFKTVTEDSKVDFRLEKLLDETTVGPGGTGDSLAGIILESGSFERAHQDQLLLISGASNSNNNTLINPVRISSIPENQGLERRVGQFEPGGAATPLPAGRAAVLEHASMVAQLDDPNVSLFVLGAQWRAQMYVDMGIGDPILRAELTENVVQSDPDGWMRGSLAAHISKISQVVTLIFKLTLEHAAA
jgi:hypothetical protein